MKLLGVFNEKWQFEQLTLHCSAIIIMVIINKSEQKSKRASQVAEHKVEKGIIKI